MMKLRVDLTVRTSEPVSDTFRNLHPRVDFGELHPYAVMKGDVRSNRGWGTPCVLASRPGRPLEMSSSCMCSSRTSWRLDETGEIVVDRLESDDPAQSPVLLNEKLTGDFFLVMKVHWRGRRTYVPFRAGKIVEDRTEWLVEPEDGWVFGNGEHRDRAPVTASPAPITGKLHCPACNEEFSVCDAKSWDGNRHRCGQRFVLMHEGQPLSADAAIHRARFDQEAVVAPELNCGRAVCPRCSHYFLIRDEHMWNGARHTCGQRISLLVDGEVLPKDRALQVARIRPKFDLARVEELSRPLLAQLHAPRDAMTISGACPNCAAGGQLRVCDGRIVLCFTCYFGLPSRLWRE